MPRKREAALVRPAGRPSGSLAMADDEDDMEVEKPPERRAPSGRASKGNRMGRLIQEEEEEEGDNDFYQQEFWADEEADEIYMALVRGVVQGSATSTVAHVQGRVCLQQGQDDLRMPLCARPMQRCVTPGVARIQHFRLERDQQRHRLAVALLRRDMQWREAPVVRQGKIAASLHKCLESLDVPIARCRVRRRLAERVGNIDLKPQGQELFDRARMPSKCRPVQRRVAILQYQEGRRRGGGRGARQERRKGMQETQRAWRVRGQGQR